MALNVTDDKDEATKRLLESIDHLREEVVKGEVNMMLICGNRHDGDYFVCVSIPPETPFKSITQAIQHLVQQGVSPAFPMFGAAPGASEEKVS